jgi:small subunit ribosomal protein S16
MAVAIRLRREGALNRPYFKVVVTDTRSPRDGKFIEIVGTYDPKKAGQNSTLKLDRIEHWISKGAQPSDTVRSLIKKTKNPEAAAKKAAASAAKKAASKPAPAPVEAEPVTSSAPAAVEPAAAPASAVVTEPAATTPPAETEKAPS